jgi:hypothetical protein
LCNVDLDSAHSVMQYQLAKDVAFYSHA